MSQVIGKDAAKGQIYNIQVLLWFFNFVVFVFLTLLLLLDINFIPTGGTHTKFAVVHVLHVWFINDFFIA